VGVASSVFSLPRSLFAFLFPASRLLSFSLLFFVYMGVLISRCSALEAKKKAEQESATHIERKLLEVAFKRGQ
jgi:hypothetical protein